jgi:hypothetical protein
VKLNVPSAEPPPENPPPSSEAPATPPAKVEKPAVWPDWFGVADLAMIVFVGLATFLLGSFTARNSDVWLHLGIGRQIAQGDYTFGKDTLSFTGADRFWVNHAWLFEWAAYQLYKANPAGTVLVAFKAMWFVIALGFVVAIRRAGHALWPWAVFGAIAAIAAAPYLIVQPIVASTPFLGATLYLLFRAEWKPGSWRNPILLAVLFGVWANVDSWFVLGPACVLIVLIGELIQARLLKGRDAGRAVPLGVPPVAGLAKALGLGIVACMLNPHHVHVWEAPAELGFGFPVEIANDSELQVLTQSPLTGVYWDNATRGYNANGLCLVLLVLGSAAALAAGFARLRASHLLLWLTFTYLALDHSQLAMFFAVVAAPLAASYVNDFSAGITLTKWTNRGTRLALTGSGVGRLVCLPLSVAMVAAAWPGWLHPQAQLTGLTRRAEWAVEADPGLERVAGVLAAWRADGRLPADVVGIIHSYHLGNYLAWFAPTEKVFINSRFNFHKPELPDFLALRAALAARDGNEEFHSGTAAKLLDGRKASYIVLSSRFARQLEISTATGILMSDPARWALWHLDGRSAVFGREPNRVSGLRFDPVVAALASDRPPVPEGQSNPPPPESTWLDEFKAGAKLPSMYVDDAAMWYAYGSVTIAHRIRKLQADAALGGFAVRSFDLMATTDVDRAVAIARLQAARRAVADNPNSPDGYFALFEAYQTPALLELWPDGEQSPGERMEQLTTAAVRFLARIPPPETCPLETARRAYLAAGFLSQQYERLNQVDFALAAMKQVKAYFPKGHAIDLQRRVFEAKAAGGDAAKQAEAELKGTSEAIDKKEQDLTDKLGERIGRFDQLSGRATNPIQKFELALRNGLPGRAIDAFRADAASYGEGLTQVALLVLDLELIAGQLEQATQDFTELKSTLDEVSGRLPPQQAGAIQGRLVDFEFRMHVLAGNYTQAGADWERMHGNGRFPTLAEADKANLSRLLPGFNPDSAAGAVLGGTAMMPVRLPTGDEPLFRGFARMPAVPVAAALQAESRFHHIRGMLFLFEGRPAEARPHFAAAPSPQGVTTLQYIWAVVDNQFKRMIDAAAAPRGGK